MNKRIYSCYSPSHRPFLEQHFLPSVPKGFDVVLRKFDQLCPSGEYREERWEDAIRQKTLLILEAIDREKEPFVFSDVDLRFYDFSPADLDEAMGEEQDLLAQSDDGTFCAGFMFIRPCQATFELFRLVLGGIAEYRSDQLALNSFALPRLGSAIKASLLPPERYWTVGPGWEGGGSPAGIAIHHANWMVGIAAKLKLLDTILALYKA